MAGDLLLEIGAEEMPASTVDLGLSQLKDKTERLLTENRLIDPEVPPVVTVFGTPRRLALLVSNVAEEQAPMVQETKGPPKKAAFTPDGQPTAAATGFAKAQGVAVENLVVKEENGGEYVFAVKHLPGRPAVEILPNLLKGLILALEFPKSMRWGTGELRFIRPIRWLVALLGEDALPFELDGLVSNRVTFGHRFLAEGPIELKRPAEYESVLAKARVMVDRDKRRADIVRGVQVAAKTVGGRTVDDARVLDEVVNLVEEPQVVAGHFDPAFLKVPRVVTITAMESHQRYFPVEDTHGELLPSFIVVHNGDPKFAAQIRHGHERVLRARLADAAFFFKEDTKTTLASKVDKLKGVVFQEKLGTMFDKSQRVAGLADWIAARVGTDEAARRRLGRAAQLYKADLVTSMVVEFPELQGAIGKEYALVDGENPETAAAIFEHYLPRFAGDRLPETQVGRVLAIADKIDSIVGCFSVGLIPTGSQDPYSLRRQARGVVAILGQGKLPVAIVELLEKALDTYAGAGLAIDRVATLSELDKFFDTRLRRYFADQGYPVETVEAVLSVGIRQVAAVARRLEIIESFRGKKQLEDAKIAFTRCKNLSQPQYASDVNERLFETPEEQGLYRACRQAHIDIDKTLADGRLQEAMPILAALRSPIDRFFDTVLVMVPEAKIRENRLKLLNFCLEVSDRIADFSKL